MTQAPYNTAGEGQAAPSWPILVHLWLYAVWRRRYAIATMVLVLPVLGLMVAMVKPKVFETRMTILIQESAKHNPFLEDLAVETRVKDRFATLDALLHSRHVLMGVAVDLGLVEEETEAETRDRVLDRLSKAVSMRMRGDELVELAYKQPTPTDIDRVMLAIAQRFMEKVLAPERSSLAGSVQFLDEQITESSTDLIEAEDALAEFLANNADSLPDLHAGNVARLAALKSELRERKEELASAGQAYRDMKRRLTRADPVVDRLERDIVALTSDLAGLRARYTDQHSAVQAAERRLSRLTAERNQLLASTPPDSLSADSSAAEDDFSDGGAAWMDAFQDAEGSVGAQLMLVSQFEDMRAAKATVEDLNRRVTSLSAEIADLEARVAKVGTTEKDLKRLERDVAVKRDVHEVLMKRAEMARVTGALGRFEAPERVKVIDQPTIPSAPAGPPPLLFIIGGVFAGLAAGGGLVVIGELIDTSFRRAADVQATTGLPVIARIPALPDPIAQLKADLNGPRRTTWRHRLSALISKRRRTAPCAP